MNLLDVLVSIVIIGILTAFFATIPGDTYQNIYQSERMTQYSTVINDVSDTIEIHLEEDPELWLEEELEIIQSKYEDEFGYDFDLVGEVIVIDEREFFKIQIEDRFFTQEFHYARIDEELYE